MTLQCAYVIFVQNRAHSLASFGVAYRDALKRVRAEQEKERQKLLVSAGEREKERALQARWAFP